jgi:hypothetical protein
MRSIICSMDTLGLLAEACQLAADLGYTVREEPLGDLPGGPCTVAGRQHLIVNLEHAPAARLDVMLRALAADPRVDREPKSRLLTMRLGAVQQAADRGRSDQRSW